MSAGTLVAVFRARMAPLAVLAAVVVAVLPPVATALVLMTADQVQVDERADRVAERLAGLASRQPVIWRYNARKIVLAAENLDMSGEDTAWYAELEDCTGQVWWSSGDREASGPLRWRMSTVRPVTTVNGAVAWVRVELEGSRSSVLLVWLVSLVSLVSGAALGFTLWRLPVATVESQGAELTRTHRQLREAQQEVTLQNAELAERVALATSRVRGLSERLMAAHQEERVRIARDLHDGLGQWLSALTMEVETGLRSGTIAPEQAGALKSTLQQISADLRGVLEGLVPASLGDGFAAAAGELLERFELRSGILTSVSIAAMDDVSEHVQAGLLRVLQEALTNVWKHAGATEIGVRVTRDADGLTLSVLDDGEGFDVATVSRRSGLAYMKDRVELLGGRLHCESTPGEGTMLRVTIPLSVSATRAGNSQP